MADNPSLMVFPCDFLIKAIGKNTATFEADVLDIVRKHFPQTKDATTRNQSSQKGSYLAISVTVYVQNQLELDALYLDLTKLPDIKMVL